MKTIWILLITISFFSLGSGSEVKSQEPVADGFELTDDWSFIRSDGVQLNLATEPGRNGNALRLDYTFTNGTGYGGIQKMLPLDLPDNYAFTFYLKAKSPSNNFEIKFLDSTGQNVWWVNNRNFVFPEEWKKIRIKKRHISFAWGPASDHDLHRVDRIEFTIASFEGGQGTIWLDDLRFESLPPETTDYPDPIIKASSFTDSHPPALVADSSTASWWLSEGTEEESLLVDFQVNREFGGLKITWLEEHEASDFDIFLSSDGMRWEKVDSVSSNRGMVSFIRLPEAEATFLKLSFLKPVSEKGYGIREIVFPETAETLTLNDFLIYVAKNSPPGDYARYFLDQASYWTITGANEAVREYLLNEDGIVEVEKARFSLEPVIKIADSLYNWNQYNPVQSLGPLGAERDSFTFRPTVTWNCRGLECSVAAMATENRDHHPQLSLSYTFLNTSEKSLEVEFDLLIRPFQVNPHYQFLNLPGGVGEIQSIKRNDISSVHVDNQVIRSLKNIDDFGAITLSEGNLMHLLRTDYPPDKQSVVDPKGLATGFIQYKLSLKPGEADRVDLIVSEKDLVIPAELQSVDVFEQEISRSISFWDSITGHIRFHLPSSADPIVNTYRSNLAYILVNRDQAGIQPGSRSYERSWIRDGALTSSALLKSGIVSEVREFIDWYTANQFENGKVPCVVDFRGPDPVPENDSHGELIYLIREYFNFTKDTSFLRSKNTHVLKAVDYMVSLIAQRSTDYYRTGNDSIRALYGLMPESISHEGYSAKPMHSYWDDFFTLKGFKDAAEIQKILGEESQYFRLCVIRDTFRVNLYRSIDLAMKNKGIDYIPGCAELGDFDATSTTIALTPCNELNNLPRPQVYQTFDRYFDYFTSRRDGKIDWANYTPYENRLIGSFIMLDQPERAHELIAFFLQDQRPQGWNHWAEVVWKDYRAARFIGDMPHTWVGSDFINAIRTMFVYENEYDSTLVVGAALCQDWIDAAGGMAVEHLPTYYGELSYTVIKQGNSYRFSITGNLSIPENGIRIRNFNGSLLPSEVTINGKPAGNFSSREIPVHELPAEVIISYEH